MGWIFYVFVQVISFILMVVGWVILIPFAWGRWWVLSPSPYYRRSVLQWRGGWATWLWGNSEDGVTGAEWYRIAYGETRWRAYVWSALRNPVGNLRWLVARKRGPFYRWISKNGKWYFQCGFRPDNGWPVFSGGANNGFDY
jgi:hypothetical protein